MTASEIMTKAPHTVTPTQTVDDAVEIMKSENCGVVPVVNPEDKGILVGIITDRDIAIHACGKGEQGPLTAIVNAMTMELVVVSENESLDRVREVMENAGVRRVPVISSDQRLVGIISMSDLANNLESGAIGATDDKILSQKPNN